MTTQALNSGAINRVRFPGSEEGASVVDMVGAVQVAASFSAITLRILLGAQTTASASAADIYAKARSQLGAGVQVFALSSSQVVSKTPLPAGQTLAKANADSGIRLKVKSSAQASAVATVFAGVNTLVSLRASAIATATSSLTARTLVYRSASTQGVAETVAGSLRRRITAASQSAVAATSAVLAFRVKAVPVAIARATASASAQSLVSRGAQTLGKAPGSANVVLWRGVFPGYMTAKSEAAAIAGLKVAVNAFTAAASKAQAAIRLRYLLGAQIQTTASAESAAADYGAAARAPEDRRMVVPATERNMRVPT